MKSDFFYSKSTGLYVSRKPLKIDSRVKKAADKVNVELTWDDEGRINFVDFDQAKKILFSLGSVMLSPVDYWKVLEDAKNEKDDEMIQELMSNKYCEWLDRIHLIDKTWIDHPEIVGDYDYSGKKKKSVEPVGKPGWFNPEENIDFELGIPKKIELFREKFATSWKYWSPDFSITKHRPRAPIRGYVTSVGKPSFDQGMPVDARQPMQMVRECRKKPLELPIKIEIVREALDLLEQYDKQKKDVGSIVKFLERYGGLFRDSKTIMIYKIREKFFDLLGLMKIEALSENNKENLFKLNKVAETLSGSLEEVRYEDFVEFIKQSRSMLKDALNQKKDIVFVMGHKNPDTDTVISSIFESWRNHLLDKGKMVYIPIVQNYKIPDEVRRLLGNELSDSILLDKEEIYNEVKQSGLARWISVDQNREPEVQRYFISIIDHHIASEISKLQDLPKTMEIIGSCAALIVQKMLGANIYPDKELGRILHGATLMDTENRVFHKMTFKDEMIMNYLKNLSGISNEDNFYSDLMSFLLNTDDSNILFGRDYKEDWGFGFAVAKIKHGFGERGKEIKKELIKKTISLARLNNENKNLPLTVLRITDYKDDNITVNRERVYLIFNEVGSEEFKSAIFELLEKIVKFEFGEVNIKITEDFVEFWGTGMQLSRKKTAPILEPVVKVFNEYFYSPSNKLWIKRDFLKKSNDVRNAEKQLKLKMSFDEEKRINYLTYPEARLLVEKLGFSILTLKEYWLALNDAKKTKDIQMIDSLQGSNFVEFLDTVFKDYSIMFEHPEITKKEGEYMFEGKGVKVIIPKGGPGLIHPDQIDLKTGIPKEVKPPSEYGNPDLWRYWEPDSDLVIPTRSYIFLLKQPCWDGKFHVKDSFPNLGIRPCCKKLIMPKVKINQDKTKLEIEIKKEGDVINYS
ncbi:manganese-dependent inorganic pyrophosphatase [subsurface metagenome]